MKTFIIIATMGYLSVTDIERIEMVNINECAKLRDVLQFKIPKGINQPLINLTCVNLRTPVPKMRPNTNG